MERINIAAVIDWHNWAWDIKVDNIKRTCKKKYKIKKFFTCDGLPEPKELEEFDIVLAWAWGTRGFQKEQWGAMKTKTIMCQTSMFLAQQAHDFIAPLFDGVITNSEMMHDMFKDYTNSWCCPNGVNIDEFKPYWREKKKFLVGSVGNSKSKGEKGFYDYITPNLPEEEVAIVDRLVDWKDFKDMPRYYRTLSAYICMSKTEGTPNPALEAGACGIPVISTEVGNMPQLIDNGYNGYLIERDADEMVDKVKLYRENPDLVIEHGKNMRKEIVRNWSWEKQVKNYEKAFEDILSV